MPASSLRGGLRIFEQIPLIRGFRPAIFEWTQESGGNQMSAIWAKKIFLASDHAGFRMKEFLKEKLTLKLQGSVEIIDLGPFNEQSVDYPDYGKKEAAEIQRAWQSGETSTGGILVCGSGQGIAMSANRFKGVRAALCWDGISARLSREHNNANILAIGGRLIPYETGYEIAQIFFTTEFAGGRHAGRVLKID
jgi:ribose 5-phosphate isomerase B